MNQGISNPEHEATAQPEVQLCVHCGQHPPEGSSLTPLCAACRQALIKYPIPKWIWAFAAGVLVLMVVGFIRMPSFYTQVSEMARAEKAMDQRNYVTAIRALDKVLAKSPDRLEANGYMLIASAYNHDLLRMQAAYKQVEGRDMKDAALLARMEEAMRYVAQVVNVDSAFYAQYELAVRDSVAGMTRLAAEVDTNNTFEHKAAAYLVVANALFDYKAYALCEPLLKKILDEQPDNYGAMGLLVALKRNTGYFDEAMTLSEKMLELNHEDVQVFAQMCRIALKRGRDKQAADLAQKAMTLESSNTAAMEAQAMVDFYAGQKQKSIAMLQKIKKVEQYVDGDSTISVRLNKLIEGKEKFR